MRRFIVLRQFVAEVVLAFCKGDKRSTLKIKKISANAKNINKKLMPLGIVKKHSKLARFTCVFYYFVAS